MCPHPFSLPLYITYSSFDLSPLNANISQIIIIIMELLFHAVFEFCIVCVCTYTDPFCSHLITYYTTIYCIVSDLCTLTLLLCI